MKFKLFGIMWDFTNIILNIVVVINPVFWIQVGSQSKEWDKRLRNELENPSFSDVGKYTCKLNGRRIWISNYPYGYGNDHPRFGSPQPLPARKTRILLRKALRDKRNHMESCENVIKFK